MTSDGERRTPTPSPSTSPPAGGSDSTGAARSAGTLPRPGSSPVEGEGSGQRAARARQEWPLWEVFVRPKAGLDHKHCGSLHAPDARMAVQLAREVYTRRQEGTSIWVVPSAAITASDPGDKDMYFDPMEDKVYRHPTFYELPDAVNHM